MMKQKEEQEAAAFKRFFQGRIRRMGWIKKIKHGSLVFLIAAIIQGYFLLKRNMIEDIRLQVEESLNYYNIISERDEFFG